MRVVFDYVDFQIAVVPNVFAAASQHKYDEAIIADFSALIQYFSQMKTTYCCSVIVQLIDCGFSEPCSILRTKLSTIAKLKYLKNQAVELNQIQL